MEPQIFYIDNMVCHRCILSVERIMADLGWTVSTIELGEVKTVPPPGPGGRQELHRALRRVGFHLLDGRSGIVARIKGILIKHVYDDQAPAGTKLSELIAATVYRDYSYTSRKFSAATGRTIEAYYTDQRMERARKLLATTELPIADVAARLKYAAPSHFSAAFRRATGRTPTGYRKHNDFIPRPLDQI